MRIRFNGYTACFHDGGVEITKEDKVLYYNKRPIYVYVKTAFAVTEFYDVPYATLEETDGGVVARGQLRTPNGTRFAVVDAYLATGCGLSVRRRVSVEEAGDDLGFETKISFALSEADRVEDFNYFAPAQWYRQNQFTDATIMGHDLDAEYFWQRETRYPLPLFAAHNIASGEMIMLSREAADIGMCRGGIRHSESTVDETVSVGAIGISRPKAETLDVLYYGYEVRIPMRNRRERLYIDYVYPCADGQMPRRGQGYHVDYMKRSRTMTRVFHPVRQGFSHAYAVCVHADCFGDYYSMMRAAWRITYERLRDELFAVDNGLQYRNCMASLTKLTRRYGDAWGLPFAAQLPMVDPSSVSFQFGFVGQQPGIGYQLIRYGDKENNAEAYQKGVNIIEFWVRTSMSEIGAPMNCYHPGLEAFEPMPFWTRMIADGLENILDAYVYMRKKGEEKRHWFAYLYRAAEWLLRTQNEDGSYYRAYNTEDGSMRMDSKANTISVVRFLVQFYLVTKQVRFREAALKAGDWSYDNVYRNMEYRGSTCDNTDIMDKESGIYAMFGFLSLYDLTGEEKWLRALVGAADYTETWTYAWSFPVHCAYPAHPFTKNRISGQSPVMIGGDGGGDMYMAACSYTYYRLFVITGDEHYRDFAEFLHQNTRQANDVDGSFGYAYPGLSHEGGSFGEQEFVSHFHWLPWVTYVEVDPTSRLADTFGCYDIAGCDKLDREERERRNRIYDNYAP